MSTASLSNLSAFEFHIPMGQYNFSTAQTAHLRATSRIIISKVLFFVFCCCHVRRHRNSGEGPSLLSPGIHSFPFKLGLPLGLPSTFLGKHGWVQYYCKAALREPGGLTHKNQQVFIVMNPIDLNLEPPILAVSPPPPLSLCIMDDTDFHIYMFPY